MVEVEAEVVAMVEAVEGLAAVVGFEIVHPMLGAREPQSQLRPGAQRAQRNQGRSSTPKRQEFDEPKKATVECGW